jgi:hypothetical protein
VSDCGIIPISTQIPLAGSIIRDNFGTFLASAVFNKDMPQGHLSNILKAPATFREPIVEAPDMITSFGNRNLGQDVVAAMATIGFTKHSSNRYVYYKGRASQANVNTIIKLGGDLDSSAPYGATNILGYLTFEMARKLLGDAISCTGAPLREHSNVISSTQVSQQGDEDEERRKRVRKSALATDTGYMIDIFSNVVVEGDAMDED